jgi:2-polyprenyl-3-methyl-5-hydroxy-6-metoxy-1,4-benzoquinol methylase
MDNKNCYKYQPLNFEDDIPIFSKSDFYVENYDRISSDHLNHFEKTGNNPFINENLWNEIETSTEDIIRRYTNNSKIKILDVGVGMGRLLEKFPTLDRFGMDISRRYLKYAKSKGIEVCMSKIEDMPYVENFFDIVVSTDVLEHVLDLNLAVEKIIATLKNGGILVVRVPYKEDLSSYLSQDCPYDFVHLRNFDENSLKILFEKIFKLEVVEFSYTGYQGGGLNLGVQINFLLYRL